MIGASKILTVSYGTFSCTLEGFDDPFNTMRAIAEYFRDLAAEDRYFGAEPPTPDAAMLHKIAEREVQRRVEAKIQDNSVILRTGDAVQAPQAMPAAQPQPTFVPTANPIAHPALEMRDTPAPMPDGVAAKLLRIRAAVANAERAEPMAAPVAPLPVTPILYDYSEDQHADEITTTTSLTATFAPDVFMDTDVAADLWRPGDSAAPATDDDDFADLAEPQETAAEMLADDNAFENESPDVGPAAEMVEAGVEISESDRGLVATTAADDSLLAALNGTHFAVDPGSVDPVVAEDTAITDDTAAEDGLLDVRALDSAWIEDATTIDAVVLQDDSDEDCNMTDDAAAAADELTFEAKEEIGEAEPDDVVAADSADDAATEAAVQDPMLEEIDSVYGPDVAPSTGPSEKALRARARVIKVRRPDGEAEVDISPTSGDTDPALAAEAEAELRRELRALQAQSEPMTEADNSDQEPDETGPEDDARQRLHPAGEAAVSRLIEQTNEAMAVPENRRRLSAIAHLKAAVAATVAERFSRGGSAPKEAETKRLDPYREDLARVVRPQHPTSSDDTPATPRPAPLVLVSAQRIDRPRAVPTGDTTPLLSAVPSAPVRPRRVTSAALAVETGADVDDEEEDAEVASLFTNSRGFAEFSERLGANSLAEILEAAAAYSVCIEGRPYFSRPQLMSQIGALSADSEYTREDGLRTFGAMLREGRIQKIKRGQFVLTENSRYLTEARNLRA